MHTPPVFIVLQCLLISATLGGRVLTDADENENVALSLTRKAVSVTKAERFLQENNKDFGGKWETAVARKHCEADGKRLCAAHHRHLMMDAVEVLFSLPYRLGCR